MESISQLPNLDEQPDISNCSFDQVISNLATDSFVQRQTESDLCQLDPRDGSMIIYAEHRSLRQDQHADQKQKKDNSCPICKGQLTHVLDVTPLSEGFTFISQNRFPILYPENANIQRTKIRSLYPDPEHMGRYAYGFHLLQWSSSIHRLDWHNMPFKDVMTCVKRLATLEEKLLKEAQEYMPFSDTHKGLHGYVSIIKNYGASAGASLTHGHQQIAYSNIMPQRTFNNQQFFIRHKETFSRYLLRENPKDLTITRIGSTRIIIPYFMRRPFNLLILPETKAERLHELSESTLTDIVTAIQKTMQAYHALLKAMNREVSYNMAIHTGPDSQIYIEFFPMVQIMGGYERIGMWICQLSAASAAAQLRNFYHD